ncbi:hypothetical protein B0A50_00424 [Salinomyces thailandicus]|uniref:Uncharacterized protein n=1 Tax=Salinomyces thailandicus TaxID=706561 RepID=A0A4U0UDL0_9PEZI|nr:hypothetical protein B0A50_00424 [Salinomyces thailandica]
MWRRLEVWLDVGRISEGAVSRIKIISALALPIIFAVAATFDAGRKQQRRDQWDQAITEVKRELGQSEEKAEQTERDIHTEQRTQENAGPRASVSVKGGVEALVEASDIFKDVGPDCVKPQWPANTGPPLMVHRLPPDSIYATDVRKAQAESRRWTPKKLETMMLSIDRLQLSIFRAIAADRQPEWMAQASAAVPTEYRKKMFVSQKELATAVAQKVADINRVRQADKFLEDWARSETDTPLCSYSQDDEGMFHATAQDLNRSLQALFGQHAKSSITTPALLAKVAYNLSITSAPPNVHTFNTLLLGFSVAQQPGLVYRTLAAFRAPQMRPNEVTNSAVLNHFTSQDDAEGFVRWIHRMRGKSGGLALARPDIRINEAGAARLVRKVKQDGSETEKVIQLPYPTPNVFSAIIRGMLKFSSFDTALGICKGMGQEGWGLCMSGLSPLLLDCAERGDWDSGLAVWQQMQTLKKESVGHYGKRPTSGKIDLPVYAAMLKLCSISGQRDIFHDVWAQALRAHRMQAGALRESVEMHHALPKDMLAETWKLWSSLCGSADGERIAGARRMAGVVSVSQEASEQALQPGHSGTATAPLADEPSTLQHVEGEKSEQSATPTTPWNATEESEPRHVERPLSTPPRNSGLTTVTWEQLDGSMPAGPDIDDYELAERPMESPADLN